MEPILLMNDVSKKFPGVQALDQVHFDLYKGEVHALIGENGAGKSTLMKILGGVYKPDQGVITLRDKHVVFNEPQDSIRQKIGVVYQEFNLVQSLSIYENLFLGKESRRDCSISWTGAR